MGLDPPDIPDVSPGDDISAEWANQRKRGLTQTHDCIGAADAEGFAQAQTSDHGDVPELYEITSPMIKVTDDCGGSDDWFEYACLGRRVRPVRVSGNRPKYALHDTDEAPTVPLWFLGGFKEDTALGPNAILHPSFAVGQRVYVVQTFDHRWILGRPMYQVRFKLTQALMPCDKATAIVIDDQCNEVTDCYGKPSAPMYVHDATDIFVGQSRDFAPDGSTGHAQWMPDANNGYGRLEVLSVGGPCCEQESSSESLSDFTSSSGTGECCDKLSVTIDGIASGMGAGCNDLNDEWCAEKTWENYTDPAQQFGCAWNSDCRSTGCPDHPRVYVRVEWYVATTENPIVNGVDMETDGTLVIIVKDCVTHAELAKWSINGVDNNELSTGGVIGQFTINNAGLPGYWGESTATVGCDPDCQDSSEESDVSECITCFDNLCAEDLENYSDTGKFAVIVEDGCLKLQPIGPCEESS